MNTNTVIDMRQFVQTRNGQAYTTSQKVAEAFGKQHYHVLAKLRELECSDHFLTHNFSWVQFDHRGNSYEACEMTKDGFMFLVMGFTGKKAAQIKEGYIAAFNWMAAQLGIEPTALINDVIGSTGEVVLDRVIDQKAGPIPASMRRSFKHTIKSRLRSRFNVQKTALIPAAEMANACNFIAAYALEGEWIARADDKPELNIGAWSSINCLVSVVEEAWQVFHRYRLYTHLSGLGCPAGSELLGLLQDGSGSARHVVQLCAAELEEVRAYLRKAA